MTAHPQRRTVLAAGALASVPFGLARAERTAPRGFDNVREIQAGDLNVGYVELGPINGQPVVLLHGWPYDIYTYVDVAPLLAAQGFRVLVPYVRGYGLTRFLSDATPRNGQQAALAADVIAFMDALGIRRAILAGCDWGARSACVAAALWPDRIKAVVSVSGYLVINQTAGSRPLAPADELKWWYQFYFSTNRGQEGYAKNRKEFARLIWRQASPQWEFDDATFERSARSLDNPDHVAVFIDNYRWRMGLTAGEPRYNELEARAVAVQSLSQPAITMEGDTNGAPHPAPSAYAKRFSGRYEHRALGGGVGHNLPQEAPAAFAQAIIDVSRW